MSRAMSGQMRWGEAGGEDVGSDAREDKIARGKGRAVHCSAGEM